MTRTWFITGASRGFGREWALAALRRGDRVAASARDVAAVADLEREFGDAAQALALDVTDREAVFATVAAAREHFGSLDVIVNNAGYGHFGMVEEVSEAEAREQLETNLFGALWVTQAVLPVLRAQGGGHILQVSSVGGVSAVPSLGIYHASKWALEGLTQALAAEIADFGIRVTLIEPGPFATDWGGASARRSAELDAYAPAHESMRAYRASMQGTFGDPAATAAAVLRIVDDEQPPLRALFGSAALDMVERDYETRIDGWRRWQPVAELAQGDPATA